MSYEEGLTFAQSINAMFLETSAINNYNIDSAFSLLISTDDDWTL